MCGGHEGGWGMVIWWWWLSSAVLGCVGVGPGWSGVWGGVTVCCG